VNQIARILAGPRNIPRRIDRGPGSALTAGCACVWRLKGSKGGSFAVRDSSAPSRLPGHRYGEKHAEEKDSSDSENLSSSESQLGAPEGKRHRRRR
jgi:hypothetical protein